MTNFPKDLEVDRQEIKTCLEKIMASPDFQASESQRRFLSFVVSETLEGRACELKGYTIATQLFGRNSSFDPKTDPIVSIHANKLRRAMERYYLLEGRQDNIIIHIPKGGYVPAFDKKSAAGTDLLLASAGVTIDTSWPTLLIKPFENQTGDPEMTIWSTGLVMDLSMELTSLKDIKILMQGASDQGGRATDVKAKFVITGSIFKTHDGIRLFVQLMDTRTSVQIWADAFEADKKEILEFKARTARTISAIIACEQGVIHRALSRITKDKKASDLKTYEAILRYYEFALFFTQESFSRAVEALRTAAENDPDNGHVWTLLARLYAMDYSLETFGLNPSLARINEYAKKGALLNPDNQRSQTVLAYALMIGNELPAALAQTRKALELNPNSLMFMDSIGYMLTLLGDWQLGPALTKKAIDLNPFHSSYANHALWLNQIQQGNYQAAYLETLTFKWPEFYWEQMMTACTCGLVNKTQDGVIAVKNLLQLKPDFLTRGLTLIRHYIKFEDLVEKIVYGLERSGLIIDQDVEV